jgi:hypothetical protein
MMQVVRDKDEMEEFELSQSTHHHDLADGSVLSKYCASRLSEIIQ